MVKMLSKKETDEGYSVNENKRYNNNNRTK